MSVPADTSPDAHVFQIEAYLRMGESQLTTISTQLAQPFRADRIYIREKRS